MPFEIEGGPEFKSGPETMVSCDGLIALLKARSPALHRLMLERFDNAQEVCRALNLLRDKQGTCAEHLRANRIFAVRNIILDFLDQS